MSGSRTYLSSNQRKELLLLAIEADRLASLLRGAAQFGEKGHHATVLQLDGAFKTLKSITDKVKEFIQCF